MYDEALAAGDRVNQAHAAFCEGLVAFVAGEVKPENSKTSQQEPYKRAAEAFSRFWQLRVEINDEDLSPPLNLTDVVAHEATGHSLMRISHWQAAKPHFMQYINKRSACGEIPPYHNLPDSFLLQRGMQKMDDAARRAHRWKHRSYSKRSNFDAHVALTAIARELDDRDEALSRARQCLEMASENEEKRSAHKNLHFLLSSAWNNGQLQPTVSEHIEANEHKEKADKLQELIEKQELEAKQKRMPNTESVDDEVDPPPPDEDDPVEVSESPNDDDDENGSN